MVDEKGKAQRPSVSPALTMILQARLVENRVETELKGMGLSLRRFGILGHVRASPGISFSALARRADIKVQSLPPIMNALLEQGLVVTVGGVEQGRAAAIELTPEGSRALERATSVLEGVDRELFANGDWKELGEVLGRVAEAFLRGNATAAGSPE